MAAKRKRLKTGWRQIGKNELSGFCFVIGTVPRMASVCCTFTIFITWYFGFSTQESYSNMVFVQGFAFMRWVYHGSLWDPGTLFKHFFLNRASHVCDGAHKQIISTLVFVPECHVNIWCRRFTPKVMMMVVMVIVWVVMVSWYVALTCAAERTFILLRRTFDLARGFGPGFSATWGADDCRDATTHNHPFDTTFYLLFSAWLKSRLFCILLIINFKICCMCPQLSVLQYNGLHQQTI